MNFNLDELTVDNISQWPEPIKYGTIVILSLFLIGLGYWLVIKDNFAEYDRLKQLEQELRIEFENKQYLASNITSYRNQMTVMEERFGNMLKKLPTENEMPGLLEDISKTGLASGLTFELFAPQNEIQHDFYIELPINITVVGNYQQLAVFLSRIGEMHRIVTLHDFVIEGASSKKQTSRKGDQLVMDITATIYRYRTQ